jgi:hypothetical protein
VSADSKLLESSLFARFFYRWIAVWCSWRCISRGLWRLTDEGMVTEMLNNEQQVFTDLKTCGLTKKKVRKALEGGGYWVFLIR